MAEGLRNGTAFAAALVQSGQELDLEELEAKIWKLVAFSTRYGNGASLTEVMTMDWAALSGYARALGEILEEEQESSKG